MKKCFLFLALCFSINSHLYSQCTASRYWPTGTYQAPASIALPTQISLATGNPWSSSGDYFKVVSFIPGRTYQVYESGGGYFTLTQNSPAGPVAFFGTNVTFTPTGTNAIDYFIHFFNNNTCTSNTVGYGIEVELVSIGGTAPTITTTQPVILSSNSATCGGNITSAGSTAVFARGVCWSNSPNPTVNNSSLNSGSGSGVFSLTVSSFAPNVTYHMRAWAANNTGTSYGNDVIFTPNAGCVGATMYPTTLQTGPTVNGQTVTVTQASGNCNYSNEYFDITLVSGNYTLNSTTTSDFFTITDQSNLILLYQLQPLAFSVNTGGVYRVHVNYSVNCQPDNSCRGISITRTGGSAAAPTVTTSAATSVGSTSATSGGNVTNAGSGTVMARGVCYSTSANPTIASSKVTSGSGTGAFTVSLTGLANSVTYHTRAYATSSVGTSYGNDVTFSTITISLPYVTTAAVTCVSNSMANTGGNVTNSGSDPITAAGVCYATAANPTIANSKVIATPGLGLFSASISGLVPGTTYHVRAFATSVAGTSYGNDVTYIACAGIFATVTTSTVTSITDSYAVCGGNITNAGNGTVSSRGICYATSPTPTLANSIVSGGSGTGAFTSNLTGLLPSTSYYVRAFATNAVGTAYGTQVTFSTTSPNALHEINGGNSILVYPNPFIDELTVKIKPEFFHAKYSITNSVGTKVVTGNLEGELTVLQLDKLPTGIYMLTIADKSSIKISKR